MKREEGGSLGERVRRARGDRSQQHVLAALKESGYDERQNWLSRIENDTTKRVDFDELVALAQVLGEDAYYLFSGERREEDTAFVRRMRAYANDLDDRGRYIVETLAALEVEESKKRAGLSEEEAELLRLFRQMTPGVQKRLLQAAGSEEAPSQRQETQRQAG